MDYRCEKKFILKGIMRFIIPSVIALIFGQLAPLVDSLCIAQELGDEALSAISTAGPVYYLFNIIGALGGIGAGVAISKASGSGEKDKAGKIFTLSMIWMTAVTVILSVLFLVFMNPLLRGLSATPENIGYTREYLTVLIAGMVFYVINFAGVYIITNDNDANLAMAGGIVSGVVNAVIDVVGMFVFHQGIWVTAFGTIFGMLCGDLVYLLHFRKQDRLCRFVPLSKLKGAAKIRDVLRPGGPEAAQYVLVTLQILLVNYFLSSVIGTSGLGNSTVIENLEVVSTILIAGVGEGIMPPMAAYFGEQNKAGLIMVKRFSMLIGVLVISPLILSLLIYPEWFIRIYSISDPVMLRTLPLSIRIMSVAQLFLMINTIAISYLASVEKESQGEKSYFIMGIVQILAIVGFSRIAPVNGPWLASLAGAASGFIYLIFFCKVLDDIKKPWKINAVIITGGNADGKTFDSWLEKAGDGLDGDEKAKVRDKMFAPLLNAIPKAKELMCSFLILDRDDGMKAVILRYDSRKDFLSEYGIEETEDESTDLPCGECIRSEFNYRKRLMMLFEKKGTSDHE